MWLDSRHVVCEANSSLPISGGFNLFMVLDLVRLGAKQRRNWVCCVAASLRLFQSVK